MLLLTLALACSDDDGTGPDSPRVATVVVEPDSSRIEVGATLQLTAAALSQDGDTLESEITWSSSATTVATVDDQGGVLALAPGRAEVSASAGDAAGTAVVIVAEAPMLDITPDSATVVMGVSPFLSAEVTGTSDQRVAWLSGDTAVARVNTDGRVSPIDFGTVVIHASLIAHPDVRDSSTIHVVAGADTKVLPENPILEVGGTVAMWVSGFGRTRTWSSSNEQVAVVDGMGVVAALSAGTSVITVRSGREPSIAASTTVTVLPPRCFAPSIASIRGANGETVDLQNLSGVITVGVNLDACGDDSGVAEAVVTVDGTIAARRAFSSGREVWYVTIDTRAYANGSHRIGAQLLNADGDVIATGGNVPVTFAN